MMGQVLSAFLGVFSFAILFHAPRRSYLACAGCGAVAWGCYLLAAPMGLFLATTLAAIVLTLLSLILFIGGQTVGGIVFLVLAFLVSPFGVPAIAEWLVDKLHSAKFALRDFITG